MHSTLRCCGTRFARIPGGYVHRAAGRQAGAFNLEPWQVANGRNVAEIIDLFNTLHTQRRGRPNAVILNTVKGIGICRHNPNWDASAPRDRQTAQIWLTELWQRSGRRLGIPEEFPLSLGEAIRIVPPLDANPDQIVEKQA